MGVAAYNGAAASRAMNPSERTVMTVSKSSSDGALGQFQAARISSVQLLQQEYRIRIGGDRVADLRRALVERAQARRQRGRHRRAVELAQRGLVLPGHRMRLAL